MDFCTIPGAILHIIVGSTSLPSYFVPSQAVSQITLLPSQFLINLDFTNYPVVTWIGLNCFKVFFCCRFQISFHRICCNDTTIASPTMSPSIERTIRSYILILPHTIFLSGKYFSSRESKCVKKIKILEKKMQGIRHILLLQCHDWGEIRCR